MGTKFGLIVGFTTGYVMGTKAGRERYEEIRRRTDRVMNSQTARSLQGGLRDAWGTAQHEVSGAVGLPSRRRQAADSRAGSGQS